MFNNQKLVNRLLAKISEAQKETLEDLIGERIEQRQDMMCCAATLVIGSILLRLN